MKKFPVLRVLDLKVEIVKEVNSNKNYVNEKYKEIKSCSGYRKRENSTKNTFRHTWVSWVLEVLYCPTIIVHELFL